LAKGYAGNGQKDGLEIKESRLKEGRTGNESSTRELEAWGHSLFWDMKAGIREGI
jgi:hypothetical protein